MKRGMLGIGLLLSGLTVFAVNANADWMWTPESGKWISEKNIEKKSAMLLYEQAQSYEEAGDIAKAIGVHRKLIRQYPASSIAPDAQYRIGQLLEAQGEYYKAFKEYEKVIQNYPSYKKFNEILEREYQIGNLFLSGEKLKILGMALLPAVDKSIEIFESIVRTAPYSSIAPRAQFNIGEAYRKVKHFAEAIPEYQKVVENYPESDLVPEARYQIGQCSYQKTLAASYDQTNTDIAIDSLQTFLKKDKDNKKSVEIKQRIDELTNRKAKKSFDIAEFYNKSHSEEAAIIYYQDVIDNFPQTEYARISSKKIDELIARPTKKKYADTHKETLETGQKRGFLAGLWPFGKQEQKAKAPVAEANAAKTASALGKKPNFLAGLWPFGPKEQAVAAAGATAISKAQARPAKKPFWAFWVKEEKKPSLMELQEDAKTPYKTAGRMRLPEEPSPFQISPEGPLEKTSKGGEMGETQKAMVAANVPAPLAEDASKPLPTAPAPAIPKAPAAPAVLQMKSFQIEQDGSTLRMLFETNGDLEFKTFQLKDPNRVLISFSKGVFSTLQETIPVNKLGVQTVRAHFRSKESITPEGKPLNALVVDLEKTKEVKVYNDLDTFVIEVVKG